MANTLDHVAVRRLGFDGFAVFFAVASIDKLLRRAAAWLVLWGLGLRGASQEEEGDDRSMFLDESFFGLVSPSWPRYVEELRWTCLPKSQCT